MNTDNSSKEYTTTHDGVQQPVTLMETVTEFSNGHAPKKQTSPVEVPPHNGVSLDETPNEPPPNEVAKVTITRRDGMRNRPAKQYIIDGLLGKNDIAMIFGAPGSGKTFVVLDLITSCVTGSAFMDRFAVPQPLTIVYATDEGADGLNQRLTASENKFVARMDGVLDATSERVFHLENMPQLFNMRDPFNIVDVVSQLKSVGKIDILILDTFADCIVGGDENSSMHMTPAMLNLKEACKSLGCAGIIVHHSGKGKGAAYRGSSALHAKVDLALEVVESEGGGNYSLSVYKQKDARKNSPRKNDPYPFLLKGDDVSESCYPLWDTESERHTQQGGDIGDILTGDMTQGEAIADMMKAWNISTRQAKSVLNRAVGEGKVDVVKGGKTGRAKMYQLAISETNQLVQ